ncbi:MAG: hypothetical protein RLZZ135_1574 [Cyanobacteriota bacterium]
MTNPSPNHLTLAPQAPQHRASVFPTFRQKYHPIPTTLLPSVQITLNHYKRSKIDRISSVSDQSQFFPKIMILFERAAPLVFLEI